MTDVVADLRKRSGLPVAGAFAFGDSPQLQDELLGFVRAGTKRATAAAVGGAAAWRAPHHGQYWGLLDGRGVAHFVAQTVDVARGRLIDVTPAFAWDEGEYDRTRESWLDVHRAFFRREGYVDPDGLDVVFERFRIVWPQEDATTWLAGGVREVRWDEREWLRDHVVRAHGTTRRAAAGRVHDVAALPGLVCEREGHRVGVLTFRPDPDRTAECVTLDAAGADAGVVEALTAGLVAVGRRTGWTRIWRVATDDDTLDPSIIRQAGWSLAARTRAPLDAPGRVLRAGRDGTADEVLGREGPTLEIVLPSGR